MSESSQATPRRVFVSYRREDTAYPAGWLYDRLAERFGDDRVFKDVDSIEPGDDFVEIITKAVGSCDVLLVLIGDRWLTITDAAGSRRIDDTGDFVRLEIEVALARNIRVVPILVGGARMPRADDLPTSLAKLANRQALELSPDRFASDLSRLLKVLDSTRAVPHATARGPRPPTTVPAPPSHLVRTLAGHTGGAFGVAFSPEGRLATASADGTVQLWDPSTGDCLRTITGHTKKVWDVEFSPDGRLATASDDGTVRLWDPSTGLRTLADRLKRIWDVAFSPDGQLLATADLGSTAHVWHVATGDCLRNLTGHTWGARGVAFSPDGRLLAIVSADQTTRLWDPATGDCQRTLARQTTLLRPVARSALAGVFGVAFSPGGRLLATASGYKTVWLWDPATGDCLRTLTGHTGWVYGVAFSPDESLLATASHDKTVRLWDPGTGSCLRTLTGHTGGVRAVAFSPDGRLLASASDDKTVRLWD